MRKKRFSVVLAVMVLFIALSLEVNAQASLGCCIADDSCEQVISDSCTAGQTYFNIACSQISNCDVGCCCESSLNSGGTVVTIQKHCDGVGGHFEPTSSYTPAARTYGDSCKSYCNLETDISCVSDLKCSDGATVLVQCSAEGKYVSLPGATCPTAVGAFVDTDGDGVNDDQDLCPNEIALAAPSETAETSCTDNIDNDCDGNKDCNDLDCCGNSICAKSDTCIIVTCGDGNLDSPQEECDDGNSIAGDGCSNICKLEYCGDGLVQPALGEICDDGNTVSGDGCENNCTLSTAVYAGIAPTECNDGVDNDGDGCFDWPFDRGCSGESDDKEDSSPSEGCAVCGDGIVDTPNSDGVNEDCETDSDCGIFGGVAGTCNIDCSCSYTCLGDPGNPEPFEIEPVIGEFANLVKWQMHPNCEPELDKMYVYRCSSPSAECTPDELLVVNDTINDVFYYHKDEPINPDTRYCYRVDAYYTTGVIASSSVQCMTTGNAGCMSSEGEYCKGNARIKCGNDNFVDSVLENCSAMSVDPDDFVCVGPRADGSTECLFQSECDQCNGLFGLFSDNFTALYTGPPFGSEGRYYCKDIPTCYIDTTRTSVNKYHSCVDIQDCYDYRSEASCLANTCQLSECEWKASTEAYEELGVGVCRPVEKEVQDCSRCGTITSQAQNIFYGDCDIETCKLYGDCYYSYGECGPIEETSCWSYTDKNDCISSDETLPDANASVNTQWATVSRADGERKIFVTFAAYNQGDFSSLSDADAICQNEADAAGLTGAFKAFLSDSATNLRDRINPSSFPYKLVDGTVVADNAVDFITPDANGNYLKNPINLDAQGRTPQNPQLVWTGTDAQGKNSGLTTCNDWTSTSISDTGEVGAFSVTDDRWMAFGRGNCFSTAAHFYCMGEDDIILSGFDKFVKVSTDNEILQESNDYFKFGLCKWIKYTGLRADVPGMICVKDADNNTEPDCEYGEEHKACQTDNIAPTTTFLLDDNPMYDATKVLLPKKIEIDYHTGESATVFFCIDSPAGNCYPNETSMCGLQKNFEGPTGDYKIRYFAEDLSHNLEKVKELPVHIDSDGPQVSASAVINTNGDGNDIKVTVNSVNNEHLVCSGLLVKGNGIPTNTENRLQFEIDDRFERNYYDLADDRYYFEYECRDYAGNAVKDKAWANGNTGVDTNRIHNPLPYGPINTNTAEISVDTDEAATCRYSRFAGSVPGFDSMTNFDTTDNLHHTKTLTLLSNEYYEYIVKCRFDDGTVEGNSNDIIRFATDFKGPSVYPITTFEAFDFDVGKTWGTDQQIRLLCRDDYFEKIKKVLNMDYGCEDKVLYKYNTDDFRILDLDSDGISTDYLLIADTGVHTITYVMNDTQGNSEFNDITIKINNEPPELKIDVFPAPVGVGSQPLNSISYGDYIIKVTSSKSLNDANISLIADNLEMPWSFLYSEDFGKVNYFQLRIPYPGEGGLAKGSTYTGTIVATGLVKMPGSVCSLNEIDETALIGTAGKAIEINTMEPSIDIDPTLNNFESIGYPLQKKGSIYYTNESRLFITGKRNNLAVDEVWFYVLNGDDTQVDRANPQKVYSYSAVNNAGTEPLNTEPLSVAPEYANKGSYTLNVVVNSALVPGNYIHINGEDREAYGNYREYYRIDWSESNFDGTWKVTLDEPLEVDLDASDKIDIYPAPNPNDWFGKYIDLEIGNNTFYARPRSASGIMPLPEDTFVIFTDPNPPVVVSQSPNKGTTNNIHTPISIVVREDAKGSLVDAGSVTLTLNGEAITDFIINEYNISSFIFYEITYQPPAPLDDGTYNVEFKGRDFAGHSFAESSTGSPKWTFKMDTKAPSTPIFTIENGTFFNGVWYVNQSEGFDLEFTDEDNVTLTAIYKDQPAARLNLGTNCTYIQDVTHSNLYRCVFDPMLEPLQIITGNQLFVKDEFQIIAEAYKLLANRQQSPKGLYYLDPLVIDNITPAISNIMYPERIKVDGEVIIRVYARNEFHDLNATLLLENPVSDIFGTEYQLEQISHLGSMYEFKWVTPYYGAQTDLDEVSENFTLRIADYAGNYNTTSINFTVDLQFPDLEGIYVSVAPTIELFEDYITRYTSVLVSGNFTDDDISSIFIIPGDYIPGQEIYDNVSQTADIYGNNFFVEMQINGTINETTLNIMNIFIVDKAGYQVSIPLNVVADLEPPAVVTSTVQ